MLPRPIASPSCPRTWSDEAIGRIEADFRRSSDTHLIATRIEGYPDLPLYLKDESSHPTGSLKHRLARSLFLYALCNGWLREGQTVVEASSGSTAISEAYFCKLLALPFVAVMPATTSAEKIRAIEFAGGRCHLVERADAVVDEARRVAHDLGGHFMDQFTYAERATDWRSNNNIAESIFQQMGAEPHPVPRWIVAGAGTGGTLATLGRFVRYQRHATRVCGVDPEHSAFFDGYRSGDTAHRVELGSRIEGIGRPRIEASFCAGVVDCMAKVPDRWSLGAMQVLSQRLGRPVGPSTGTNFVAVLWLMHEMQQAREAGSLVSLICDSGLRYGATYVDRDWLAGRGLDCDREAGLIAQWASSGVAPSEARNELRIATAPAP
jgi:cysteine synthase A